MPVIRDGTNNGGVVRRRVVLCVVLLLGSLATSAQAAWYIGTSAQNCSDAFSNANNARVFTGSTGPFCTMGRAQTAMTGTADKQTYFRQGTYNINSQFNVASNTNWATDPLDTSRSAIINFSGITGIEDARGISCVGCSNVSFRKLTFQPPTLPAGATSSTGQGGESGTIYVSSFASNIFIEDNLFQGALQFTCIDPCHAQQHLKLYQSNDLYVRGNTFIGPNPTGFGTGLNAGQPIHYSPNGANGLAWSNVYITDNFFDGCTRWCLEVHMQANPATFNHFHLDRNTFSNYAGTATNCESGLNPGAISAAGDTTSPAVNFTNSTIWGNIFNGSLTPTNCSWALELLWDGATVSQNQFTGGSAIGIGKAVSSVVETNTFTLATSGSPHQCNPRQCQFTNNGAAADGTEWVGANTINGATVTGMVAAWSDYGNRSYGTRPAVWTPSAPFATGTAPTTPGSFAVSGATVSTVNATWSASTDVDGDLLGYRVYGCFPSPGCTRVALMDFGLGTSGTIRGLVGGKSYIFALRAFDAAVTESGDSATQTISTSAIPSTNPELLLTYEPGTGTQLFDSSGHGHNSSSFTGTFSALVPPTGGGTFSGAFSGAQVARIPRTYSGESPVGLEPAAVSIATWVRRSGAQGTFTNLINKTWQSNNPNTYTSYKLLLNPDYGTPAGSDVVECEIGQTGTYILASSPINAVPDVTWVHVACTYDPSAAPPQLKLYVAGALMPGSVTSTVPILYDPTTTGDLWLADNGAGGQRFIGNLDDTRVYRSVLTLADVQALAGVTGDTTPPAAPTNLRVINP